MNGPVDGDIQKYEWVDPGTLLVYVKKSDTIYVETFEHQQTEVGECAAEVNHE